MQVALVASLISFVVLAAWVRMRLYRRWISVPARRTDRLPWSDAAADIKLTTGPAGFVLPGGLELKGRTAILCLQLRAQPLGHLIDPFVEIGDGERRFRQYFERGVHGARYLDVSPLLQASSMSGRPIQLRGRALRWLSEGTLTLFSPPATRSPRLLVLAPHPDDAEIAAFGLYARSESWIVTVTAGEKAHGAMSAAQVAIERVTDSLRVPQTGNVPAERVVNLAYPDGALAAMLREPQRAFRLGCEATQSRAQLRALNTVPQFQRGDADCRGSDLIDELREIVQKTAPDIIVAPHPVIDGHPDHVFTTVALAHALAQINAPLPELYLYAVHVDGARAHPLGPADALASLPPGCHQDWIAESLYSNPLSEQVRQDKVRALAAMAAVVRGSHGTSVRERTLSRIAGLGASPTNLLRRAPRPNELFYRVQGSRLVDLFADRVPELKGG